MKTSRWWCAVVACIGIAVVVSFAQTARWVGNDVELEGYIQSSGSISAGDIAIFIDGDTVESGGPITLEEIDPTPQMSDPCGDLVEGSLFYNDDDNIMCYCATSLKLDRQVAAPLLDCFGV